MTDYTKEEVLALAEKFDTFENIRIWGSNDAAIIYAALCFYAEAMSAVPVAYRYRLQPDFSWHLATSIPTEVRGNADWAVEPLYVAPVAETGDDLPLADDTDPVLAGLVILAEDGYATDRQRSIARSSIRAIQELRAMLATAPPSVASEIGEVNDG